MAGGVLSSFAIAITDVLCRTLQSVQMQTQDFLFVNYNLLWCFDEATDLSDVCWGY